MLSHFRAAVAASPDAAAILYFDATLSYAELDRHSDALAGWLAEQGVAASDRVCVILQNGPQAVIAFLAAWKIGAVVMPCNPMYQSGELAKLFADAEPRVVVCETEAAPNVSAALAQAGVRAPVVSTGRREFQTRNDPRVALGGHDQPADKTSASTFQAALQSTARAPAAAAADIGVLLYTSGTTGAPKGVMLRPSSLLFNAETCRDSFSLTAASRILGVAPLFHITGIVCHVLAAFAARCPTILGYRFHPDVMLDAIREHRPTFAIGAITAFSAFMRDDAATADDFACFQTLYSGGAPIPAAVRDAFRQRFGKRIQTSFGMTETAAPTHLCPPDVEPPSDPASGALAVGKPVASTQAMIVDDAGAPLPPGEPGELLVRGPQIMQGYWRKPEETAAALADGWMHTGDVAVIDAQQWCYIVDRKKDMICASGFKIWPREVEDLLYQMDAVRQAVVVGKPDDYRGETVKAYVSLKQGAHASPDEIIAFARANLAAYKAPREVEILEDLPATETGKLSRAVLRRRAAEETGRPRSETGPR